MPAEMMDMTTATRRSARPIAIAGFAPALLLSFSVVEGAAIVVLLASVLLTKELLDVSGKGSPNVRVALGVAALVLGAIFTMNVVAFLLV